MKQPPWGLLVAGVVGVAGLVAGVSAPERLNDTGSATAARQEPADGWSVSDLSLGAPPGAITLPAVPVTSGIVQPVAATTVSGLAANGIPEVALNAYRVAAARMASAQPSCGIDWSLLAGIGRIESHHGLFGGAVLNADGTSTPEIRGPALNGVNFAYIADSDDGAFDHDPTYDRAVGPMQFIPTTWRSYAIDADGNHTADPFDIDDAALAAAHYLCVAGRDLTTESGQRRAILAYNHSDSYVAQVLALARAYASGIWVDGVPLRGDVSGRVPPPTGFFGAPASPGPALAAGDTTSASGPTSGRSDADSGSSTPASTADDAAAPPASSDGAAAKDATDDTATTRPEPASEPRQPTAPPPAAAVPEVQAPTVPETAQQPDAAIPAPVESLPDPPPTTSLVPTGTCTEPLLPGCS